MKSNNANYYPNANGYHHNPPSYGNGPTRGLNGPTRNGSGNVEQSRAVRLLNELHATMDEVEDKGSVYAQLYPDTQAFLQRWIGDVTAAGGQGRKFTVSSGHLLSF